jgi:flagellar protein FlgJ
VIIFPRLLPRLLADAAKIDATGYHLFTQTAHNPENLILSGGGMDKSFSALTAASKAVPQGIRDKLAPTDAALLQKAKDLETSFLAEMLGHAGLGSTPDAFGGGIGEQQFASFLRNEQAKAMVEKGGIGLAQQIFESLKQRQEHDPAQIGN